MISLGDHLPLVRRTAPAKPLPCQISGNIGGQLWAMPAAIIASIVIVRRLIGSSAPVHPRQQPLLVPALWQYAGGQPLAMPRATIALYRNLFCDSSLACASAPRQQPLLRARFKAMAGNYAPQPSPPFKPAPAPAMLAVQICSTFRGWSQSTSPLSY